MKSIEERANEKYPVHLVTRNGMPWTEYDANEKKRNFYIEIATEQKDIDDAELTEVKRQRDEYYDELLSKRQRIAELEAKLAQTSEKAIVAYENELRRIKRVLNERYGAGGIISVGGSLIQFKKAMEE